MSDLLQQLHLQNASCNPALVCKRARPSGSKQPCRQVVPGDVSKLSLAEASESTSLQPLRLEVQTPTLDSIGQKMLPHYFYLFSGLMTSGCQR